MQADRRIALAARNNAEWCDAVTRAWGGQGRFEAELWINPGEAPPFYPNAVTLTPLAGAGAIAAAAARADFAVKDSFAALDLSSFGFGPLLDAQWIWRDPRPIDPGSAATWRIIRDPGSLARWETAWRAEDAALDLFRPALLEAPDHAFIAGAIGGRIVAGCVAGRSGAVVGISNLFGATALWPGCLATAMDFAPHLPLVGYESGAALETMKSLGFQTIGPLRVWLRAAG